MNSQKLSPVKNIPGCLGEGDEPYPSLSDYHDYEPNLEFDDSELHQPPDAIAQTVDLIQSESNNMGSPLTDFADENFEEELANGAEENLDSLVYSTSYPAVDDSSFDERKFSAIAQYRIVDVKGDDSLGRKIIVVYACKLPPIKNIDHTLLLSHKGWKNLVVLKKLPSSALADQEIHKVELLSFNLMFDLYSNSMSYMMYTLDKYVEQDYSLVYFHYGLSSKNKPSLGWLVQAYKAFDRKYKKNLQALYLVHPTGFLKFVSQIFKPLISAKFGKKINYINTLKELNEQIPLDKLDIPQEVKEHDMKIGSAVTSTDNPSVQPTVASQQFGVSLQFIKEHYQVVIPPVVRQCIEHLDQPDALETEGIFRRSAKVLRIRQLKEEANLGQNLVFENPHEAAVLLKTFLRQLSEPLLTFDSYDEIMTFQSWNKDEILRTVSILVMEKLPEDNYKVLKYIISFLSRVMERSDLNKMNAQNLAVVFGPNLIWHENETMSLSAIGPINMFAQFLLLHHSEIFIV